jgi:acetyl esterase/lipase
MKRLHLALVSLLILAGCEGQPASPPVTNTSPGQEPASLVEARRGFVTKLVKKDSSTQPVPQPPAKLFRVVHYESPVGKLPAYLGTSPGDGKKHPAIIWIFGGFDNDIGDSAWKVGRPDNDQSAAAFRNAEIVMMYPSLRGGNEGVGFREGFYGEVDDVLAAADFLAKQDYVDPNRIYLGGHSTGGTLAMLAAAMTDRFRAVFSFGPASTVAGYGGDNLPFDTSNRKELELRSPILWLGSIRSPTFVLEGTDQPGNLGALQQMSRASSNPRVRFHPVKGVSHFSILAPVTRIVADAILRDDGPTMTIAFTEAQLDKAGTQ